MDKVADNDVADNDVVDNGSVDNDVADWLDDEQRILNIQQNPVREPMKSIRGVFIFINQYHYIDKIVVEDIVSFGEHNNEFRIPFSQVLRLVQSKRYVTSNTKYIFREVCLFNVDLEAEHVQGFVNDGDGDGDGDRNGGRFFRVLPATEDIIIPPSIFIFHSVNTLYFYFQEVLLKRAGEPRSILKTVDSENPKEMSHNTTKKRVSLKEKPVVHSRENTKYATKNHTKRACSRGARETRKHISVKHINT